MISRVEEKIQQVLTAYYCGNTCTMKPHNSPRNYDFLYIPKGTTVFPVFTTGYNFNESDFEYPVTSIRTVRHWSLKTNVYKYFNALHNNKIFVLFDQYNKVYKHDRAYWIYYLGFLVDPVVAIGVLY